MWILVIAAILATSEVGIIQIPVVDEPTCREVATKIKEGEIEMPQLQGKGVVSFHVDCVEIEQPEPSNNGTPPKAPKGGPESGVGMKADNKTRFAA